MHFVLSTFPWRRVHIGPLKKKIPSRRTLWNRAFSRFAAHSPSARRHPRTFRKKEKHGNTVIFKHLWSKYYGADDPVGGDLASSCSPLRHLRQWDNVFRRVNPDVRVGLRAEGYCAGCSPTQSWLMVSPLCGTREIFNFHDIKRHSFSLGPRTEKRAPVE